MGLVVAVMFLSFAGVVIATHCVVEIVGARGCVRARVCAFVAGLSACCGMSVVRVMPVGASVYRRVLTIECVFVHARDRVLFVVCASVPRESEGTTIFLGVFGAKVNVPKPEHVGVLHPHHCFHF